MVGGPVCFGLLALLPLIVGYSTMGPLVGVVWLYVLQGLGRGVWESTNKAVVADYFSYDNLGAFSNLIVANGGASAIVFFVNAYGGTSPTIADCTCNDPTYA